VKAIAFPLAGLHLVGIKHWLFWDVTDRGEFILAFEGSAVHSEVLQTSRIQGYVALLKRLLYSMGWLRFNYA
jgi:hypothetical protein